MMELKNLYDQIPSDLPEELFTEVLKTGTFRVERIVSQGHASPEGFWYDQEQNEWVIVLQGAARIRFEGEMEPVELRPGDYLTIPAHRRHRVEWTAPDERTVWLAFHY
jgi:cupin 2 domain-containing protein